MLSSWVHHSFFMPRVPRVSSSPGLQEGVPRLAGGAEKCQTPRGISHPRAWEGRRGHGGVVSGHFLLCFWWYLRQKYIYIYDIWYIREDIDLWFMAIKWEDSGIIISFREDFASELAIFSIFSGAKSADWTDGFFGCSFLNVLLVYCYGLYPDDDRKLWSMTFPEPRRMWAAFSDHWLTGKAIRGISYETGLGIAFSCLISGWILWFMVDITNYLMGFINQQTSLGGGGQHPLWVYLKMVDWFAITQYQTWGLTWLNHIGISPMNIVVPPFFKAFVGS